MTADWIARLLISPATWSIAGLVANLAGVLLLFRYGMPYRVPTGGGSVRRTMPTEHGKGIERLYGGLGWLGLILIVLGTASQVVGAWLGG
jgi:hypothetical protein